MRKHFSALQIKKTLLVVTILKVLVAISGECNKVHFLMCYYIYFMGNSIALYVLHAPNINRINSAPTIKNNEKDGTLINHPQYISVPLISCQGLVLLIKCYL